MQNGEGKFCIFVGVWKNDETMMEFKDRRSIRKYSRRGLPEGLIEALAGEASRAATMGNMQLYSLVVTEDGPEREALAEAHHHQPMVEEAPAVLGTRHRVTATSCLSSTLPRTLCCLPRHSSP